MMSGDGPGYSAMLWGMGLFWILGIVLLVLAIFALMKYTLRN